MSQQSRSIAMLSSVLLLLEGRGILFALLVVPRVRSFFAYCVMLCTHRECATVVWTKDNPTPWNDVKPNENIKLLSVNQQFDKRQVRSPHSPPVRSLILLQLGAQKVISKSHVISHSGITQAWVLIALCTYHKQFDALAMPPLACSARDNWPAHARDRV